MPSFSRLPPAAAVDFASLVQRPRREPARHRPLPAYRTVSAPPEALRFRAGSVVLNVQALAPDLFRLVAHGHREPAPASWAITDLPALPANPPVSVRTSSRRVALATELATFTLSPTTGAWDVVDRHGLPVFSCPAGGLAFGPGGFRLDLTLVDRESIFGLGESTGTMDKRGLIRDFWNIDVLGHAPGMHPTLRSLYVSIPFALSLRDGRAAGLFWDNPGRQSWDLGASQRDRWRLSADTGALDLYLFTGPRPADVLRRFTDLTGRTPLPPRWALGYQQSRYSYETAAELESVARELRRRRLPCDVLYCDIHHLDGHRVFTFGSGYPRPDRTLASLARRGFKVVPIVNPGVKDDPRFDVLRRGRRRDVFVKDPGGRTDALGEAWPGRCRFPDFLRTDVRAWWAEEQQVLHRLGVAGIWNDMNEPANFGRPDKSLDPAAWHRSDHGRVRHAAVHNVYGQQMARASYEGATRPGPGGAPARRPLVVTRSGYAGIQRYAAVWTGDNASTWEHLDESVRQLLNLGSSGVPFVGADVGGFLEHCTPELFVRWLQTAIFTPFLRNHSNLGTARQEPWAFGPDVETIARDHLQLRYQLLPYLYGLFVEASRTGAPVMRPLLWHYPNDPTAVACSDQFLVGEDLLVAPVLRPGAVARSVYLPRGEWFEFRTGACIAGGVHAVVEAPLERIPIFVRGGALLPLGPVRQYVGRREPGILDLHLWPGTGSRLDWYDDDGQTLAHTGGAWQRRTFTGASGPRGGHLDIGAPEGPYRGPTRTWRIVLREVHRAFRVRVGRQPIPSRHIPELDALVFELPALDVPLAVRWS